MLRFFSFIKLKTLQPKVLYKKKKGLEVSLVVHYSQSYCLHNSRTWNGFPRVTLIVKIISETENMSELHTKS